MHKRPDQETKDDQAHKPLTAEEVAYSGGLRQLLLGENDLAGPLPSEILRRSYRIEADIQTRTERIRKGIE